MAGHLPPSPFSQFLALLFLPSGLFCFFLRFFFVVFSWIEVICFRPPSPFHLCLSLRYPSDPLDPFLWFTHLPLRLLSDLPTVYRSIPVDLHHSLRGTCRECGDRIITHFHWLSHRWIVGRPEWPRLKGPPGRMVSEFDSSQKFLSGLLLMYKA